MVIYIKFKLLFFVFPSGKQEQLAVALQVKAQGKFRLCKIKWT